MVSLFSCHSLFAPRIATIGFFWVICGLRFFPGLLLVLNLLCLLLISDSVMRKQSLEIGSIPVSYTHLTLPTKRIV